jgi:chromosome segregation ATPase
LLKIGVRDMAEITKKDILEALQEFSNKTLDPKFEKIDQRFEKIDQRFEKAGQRINDLDHKVDQFKEEIIHQFHVISEDVISQVKLVAEGVMNLDEKFTREMTQFRKENEQAHQEIKAMIKFSYAELDRRISTLEGEVKELKHRVDQIERRSVS